MSQKTRRLRYSVLIGMVFALLAGLFAGASPAGAVGSSPEGVPVNLVGGSQPDVFRSTGATSQDAGDLTLAVDATHQLALAPGERIIVEVSDGLGDNCDNTTGTGRYIGFDGVPTVTVSPGSNVIVSAQLAQSNTPGTGQRLRTASGNVCSTVFSPTTFDQLLITVTQAPNPFGTAASITVSNIKYKVGSQAAPGFATLLWAADAPTRTDTANPVGVNDGDATTVHDVAQQGCSPAGGDGIPSTGTGTAAAPGLFTCANANRTGSGNNDAGISNAYISNLMFAPPAVKAIRPGSGRTVGDFTLTETDFAAAHPLNVVAPGDPTLDGLCLQLLNNGSNVVHFTAGGTATATTGDDVPGTVAILGGGDTLRIPISPGVNPAISTFTLSGVTVSTDGFGPQFIHVYQCDSNGIAEDITSDANNPAHSPGVTEYTNTTRLLLVVVNAERYAGTNRNDTARVIADRDIPCNNSDQSFAIVARNDQFSDALAASYISGQTYAPILLVNTHGAIPQETLDSLHQHGVTDVIIMGGNVAVGDDVEAALQALEAFDCSGAARRTPEDLIRHVHTQRVQGPTRFDTARAGALFTFGGNTIGFLDSDDPYAELSVTCCPTFAPGNNHPLRTAILVNGLNFPDAMVAGPMAFQGLNDRVYGNQACNSVGGLCDGYPILLANGQASTLPAPSQSLITERNIEQVLIIGGIAAVPQSIQDGLTAQGIKVIRLGGDTRQDTAVTVANFEYRTLAFGELCPDTNVAGSPDDPEQGGSFGDDCSHGHVALARGDNFPDALTMGPLAGNDPNNTTITNLIQAPGLEPILLTQDAATVGAVTDAYLGVIATQGPNVFWIDVAGGTTAISAAAQDEALNALVG